MFIFYMVGMVVLFTIVLWFTALIHCVWNRYLRGGEKIAWSLLFFITGWIGSLIYFVYWFGFAKQRRIQPVARFQPSYRTYQSSYAPQPQQNYEPQQQSYAAYEQSYTPYEQGYQPVKTTATRVVKPFIAEAAEQQEIASPLYEQPQVMYPEDPR